MGYPRRSQVSINDTPYYHVVVRCVRRAWLWGNDPYAGRDYSHRRNWVLERLQALIDIYAIDICAYAIMSNHYHLVLHVDRKRAEAWKPVDVAQRWSKLYSLPPIIKQWVSNEANAGDSSAALAMIEEWRCRLFDVSWFMRSLNENLARRANAEDECTGRFWEGRFKSRALVDDIQLLSTMAYVDLNAIRAGAAATPETSEFTSVHARVREWRQGAVSADKVSSLPIRLMSFRGQAAPDEPTLPLRFVDYLQLVDWTGRLLRPDKSGAIKPNTPPILQRLGIDAEAWSSRCEGAGGRRRQRVH